MAISNIISNMADSLGSALQGIGTYSAAATAKANSISQQAQSAQGAFNQASANQANMLNDAAMQAQYGFNAAQAQMANEFSAEQWQQTARWNEKMWQKQADFNAEQAQLNRDFNAVEAQKLRDWQTNMANTSYQRAMADMSAAGLNPILAYAQGGANVPGGTAATGTAATVGGAQMSSASGQMASGGLLGANTASESNFTGQMENMSTTLALLGALFSQTANAQAILGGMGDLGESISNSIGQLFELTGNDIENGYSEEMKEDYKKYSGKNNKDWWDTTKDFILSMFTDRPATDAANAILRASEKKHNSHGQERDQYLRENAIKKSWEKYWKPKG